MSRRGGAGGPDGLAVVDKPAGWTSHDVVARLRGVLRTRRVGHGGTLDPDATGVLVVGVGAATRLLAFVSGHDKSYTGEVVLGTETDSLDAAGTVVATHDMAGVTPADVEAAARTLVGDLLQVPPMVSAVKVGGRRLHELAREGVEVERAPRPVHVTRLVVEPTGDPAVYRLEVTCSAGTYVRVLAADLGRALGGGAHLRALRRTASGPFTLAEARTLEAMQDAVAAAVATGGTPGSVLEPPLAALRGRPQVVVNGPVARAVGHGAVLDAEALGLDPGDLTAGPWAVVDGDGTLLAVYADHGRGRVKPAVVLAAAGTAGSGPPSSAG